MNVYALQTGTVRIKEAQRVGQGRGPLRLAHVLGSGRWTEPLPIYTWLLEHPDGLIVVDTGESAGAAKPGYFPAWHHRWPAWCAPSFVPFAPAASAWPGLSFPLTRDGAVRLVSTPGHTPHHLSVVVCGDGVSYFLAGDTSVYAGRTLGGAGRRCLASSRAVAANDARD